MSTKNTKLEETKHRPEAWWFLTDRWFRIVEFSLVLGTLYFFDREIGSIPIKALYWLSWFFFYAWSVELGEYIADKFSKGRSSKKKWLVWTVCMFVVIGLYTLITTTANLIIEKQFTQ